MLLVNLILQTPNQFGQSRDNIDIALVELIIHLIDQVAELINFDAPLPGQLQVIFDR